MCKTTEVDPSGKGKNAICFTAYTLLKAGFMIRDHDVEQHFLVPNPGSSPHPWNMLQREKEDLWRGMTYGYG
ncbi:hypothetical protein H8959_016748 [Pygathrix nigripes]